MLEVSELTVSFDGLVAVDSLNLTVPAGSIAAVMGPSGCGKSTLLRTIAGLERPDAGRISWRAEDVKARAVHDRPFGLMFQDYALFPHLNVHDNVAFALRIRKDDPVVVDTRVAEALRLVGMEHFANRGIDDLSGGEQQRVALARTLAPEPELLLLDEPLGSLDRALRTRLLAEMREIFRDLDITVVYVTHDTEEAFGMADAVAVMRAGSIAQRGSPQALWTAPASALVARLLGHPNVVALSDVAALALPSPPGATHLVIPPAAIELSNGELGNGEIVEVRFASERFDVFVAIGDAMLVTHSDSAWDTGIPVLVTIAPEAVVPVPFDTEEPVERAQP